MAQWIRRWGYEMKPTTAPGVMALKGGGFLVHGKKGRKRRLMRIVRVASVREAQRERLEMLAQAARPSPQRLTPLFATYAISLFKRKVAHRELKSAATRELWESVLKHHLVPAFGHFQVDAIGKLEIESWKTDVSERIARGKYKPTTANSWWTILRIILRTSVADYDLPRDPTLKVKPFSTEEHRTYTREQPNALRPEQVPEYLAAFRRRFPRAYAMALLAFVTGLRPSSLRPLRHDGAEKDVDWELGSIEIRRSHSRAQVVMNTTKTSNCYTIGLPQSVMRALEKHVAAMTARERKSGLLFPSTTGRLEHQTMLTARCHSVNDDLGLKFRFTGRGFRRTFQDLARKGGLRRDIQKAICGHESDDMTALYSTFRPEETAAAVAQIARVVLPSARKRRRAA